MKKELKKGEKRERRERGGREGKKRGQVPRKEYTSSEGIKVA